MSETIKRQKTTKYTKIYRSKQQERSKACTFASANIRLDQELYCYGRNHCQDTFNDRIIPSPIRTVCKPRILGCMSVYELDSIAIYEYICFQRT